MKKSKSFKKGNNVFPQQKKDVFIKPQQIDTTIQAIEMARINGQGVITYHFESQETFDDYSKYDMNNLPKDKLGNEVVPKPEKQLTGTKKSWNISKPINKEVFFDEKGNPQKADKIKLLFIQTAADMGAKYFTI